MFAIVAKVIYDLAIDGEFPFSLSFDPLDPTTEIDKLGLDSAEKLLLIGTLEEKLNKSIPESALSGLNTLGDLAAVFEKDYL
jgi:acyl carrier protein